MELLELTALELGKAIKSGAASAREARAAAMVRIRTLNEENRTFLSLGDETDAVAADTPLAGVPMAVKDNICTRTLPTTCASKMLEQFTPPYDATAVERLWAGGAVLLGKLNMDEFGMGSTGETSYFGPVGNPWDATRSPGGSSGGAAAAVAAGECWYALGSDTGGSVRQPAAHCGVTGMKPTYGLVSRYGLVAYASSFDQIGPIARTAADCAAVLDLIKGRDGRDTTMPDVPQGQLLSALDGDIRGWRIGLPEECFGPEISPTVAQRVLEAAAVLERRGAVVERCTIPALRHGARAYYAIACAEASSNLARYDGVRYGFRAEGCESFAQLCRESRTQGFGSEVKRRILLGTYVLSPDGYESIYQKAMQAKLLVTNFLDEALKKYDLLLTPTCPDTAPKLGAAAQSKLDMHSADTYTVPANLAGLPALSMPCGFDGTGMPVGVQLMGARWGDARVLNAAHAYQMATDWHRRTPKGGMGK